ncbi:MAG: single-stranded-DNA-specific exonuclease RecJ [Alphaproteobacteria bacterium]|nr:single-stranded-DNA-specific exonuclease RecJ [Alphaproteobacteria bacterium]
MSLPAHDTAPDADQAFLGVAKSATGRRWLARPTDRRLAAALSQRFGVSDLLGAAMAARGVDLDSAEAFLEPKLRALLPDPSSLRDLDKAVDCLVSAVTGGEPIALFGDYDVDGAASAALLARFLEAVGGRVTVYIPDRAAEGYGPNAPAIERLGADGHRVLVTLDCGTTAFEALQAAEPAGMDAVIVDHHVAEPRLPDVHAVVNPNRLDEDGRLSDLAACGVTFVLIAGLNRALRRAGWYGEDRPEPDLRAWLDIVALGTVCDVVPLVGLNRAFVVQGLKVMARGSNPGLRALADIAGLDGPPKASQLGFALGPRINAGGRVGESALGARLLRAEDDAEANAIARRLNELNSERQAIERSVLTAATAAAEAQSEAGAQVLLVGEEGWHQGVIGIVASRLVDRFHRPACVMAFEGGTGKGSGRSVRGFDLGSAIIAARQSGLLVAGGGHAMAGGFTVEREKVEAFQVFLSDRFARARTEHGIEPTLHLDGVVQPAAATVELAAEIDRLAPFGPGNPQPRVALPAVRLYRVDVVGNGHVRGFLAGEGERSARLKAIAFRAADAPLGQLLLQSGGAPLHVAGTLQLNRWNGRTSVQLVVEDAAPVR